MHASLRINFSYTEFIQEHAHINSSAQNNLPHTYMIYIYIYGNSLTPESIEERTIIKKNKPQP